MRTIIRANWYGPVGAKTRGLYSSLIALYVFFLPVQIPITDSLRLAPSDLFMIACIVLGLGRIRLRPDAWSPWHFGLVAIFAGATLVTAMKTGEVRSQVLLQKDLGLLLLMASYTVISDWASSPARRQWLLRLLVHTVVVHNIISLIEFGLANLGIYHVAWMNYGSDRLAGLLVDPNAYGGLVVLALLLHLTTTTHRSRTADLLFTLTLTGGVLLTFSRSAWIGLLLAICLGLVIYRRLLSRLILTGLFAMGLILAVLGPAFLEVMVAMSSRPSQVESRLDYIITALDHFSDSPLWGTGIGFFSDRYGWIIHNTTIWFMAEFGVIGLAIFAGFTLWFLLLAWEGYRTTRGPERSVYLGLLMADVAMLGLSVGIEAFYQRHWWLIMGLIAAARAPIPRGGPSHETSPLTGGHSGLNHTGFPAALGRPLPSSRVAGRRHGTGNRRGTGVRESL